MSTAARSPLVIESAAWGPTRIEDEDIDVLSALTGLSNEQCIEKLAAYRLEEMASAWQAQNPSTGEEIRAFYSETDLYLWELLTWNGSDAYRTYCHRLERLVHQWPPHRWPTALDYGCGVGTAAIWLAAHGYHVTIADIPGRTLEFAKARLRRRGIAFDVLEITENIPELLDSHWDILVCFDVIEHVLYPDMVARALVRAIRPGGGAAIVAGFDARDDLWPHHLADGVHRFGGHRWRLFLQWLGMREWGDGIYSRTDSRAVSLLLQARYLVWKATGLYVQRLAA